ncbi:unnamed protein product [Brassicogethes aeneus]|uniref:DUF4817 domain-containing protein n=1 Tax=Brassicogethes aeneus TaxID=1431903 RepID=A0A9P0AXW4_BRAAE|nr:unnamed protein product [Brassicogethes aeneus]
MSVKALPFVKMPSISIENRIKNIETYNENGRCVKTTYRKIRDMFGRHGRPSENAIKNLVDKFKSTGSTNNIPTPIRVRPGRSAENIAAVSESVEQDPNLSIPRRSQQLGLSTMTTWRILRKDLSLKPYKVQLVQELKPADHYVRQTMDLLQTKFPDRVISRNSAVNWPPRSCDLTPLDYFLWGYVKDKVYADNPLTIEALKANIERAIREIEPQLCQNVITNFNKRIDVCRRTGGGHLNDIIFHL